MTAEGPLPRPSVHRDAGLLCLLAMASLTRRSTLYFSVIRTIINSFAVSVIGLAAEPVERLLKERIAIRVNNKERKRYYYNLLALLSWTIQKGIQ